MIARVRDRLIAELAADGKTSREIAVVVGMSYSTVKLRLTSIYKELGIEGGAGGVKRRQLAEKLGVRGRKRPRGVRSR